MEADRSHLESGGASGDDQHCTQHSQHKSAFGVQVMVIIWSQVVPLKMITFAHSIHSTSLLSAVKSWSRTRLRTIYNSSPGILS
ncbi:hypothetical protein MHYP_G00013450 [Metynnis hypsauchen]